jgi:uncharacterized protein YbjT (DUF2867 family)
MSKVIKPPILVTGGTGTLGRLVVASLRDAGSEVRVLSRHGLQSGANDVTAGPEGSATGPVPVAIGPDVESVIGDLATGQGVDAAVAGIETIVHCAGGRSGDGDIALNLVRAASRAGARHLVHISVVGADRIPVNGLDRLLFGYFDSKRMAERVITESGIPWTMVRATQFYELVAQLTKQMARLPVVPVPRDFRFQPVDAGEVAARLAELALGPPSGLVPDLGGPKVYGMAELLRIYLRAMQRDRTMISIPMPGRASRAIREGAALTPERAVGRRTWEQFVAGEPADVPAAKVRRAA